MGFSGGGAAAPRVDVPVYQASNTKPDVTAAVAQDISGQNQASVSTMEQVRKRSGGIAATYNRFQNEQMSGKTKLGV